jgi:GNAT superfamily N-acetyltransferase
VPLELRHEPLSSPIVRALVSALNEELSAQYPELGATHFCLDSEEVTEGHGAFVVAWLDGSPVGCGGVRRLDATTAELKRMYVAPGTRGRGVGRALLEELEHQARRLGVRRLLLETGVRQRAALVLYEHAGFVIISAFGEYRDSALSVCMAKDLTAVHVRIARPTDRGIIEAVTLAAYHEYATQMPELWERYRQNIVGTLASAEPRNQLVAEREGEIVGAVLLLPAGSTLSGSQGGSITLVHPEVRLLAVAPAARGLGVGRSLMRLCIRRARESGAPALTLHTTEMMRVAMRLYEGMGFLRAPDLDLSPLPGVSIKGYRLLLAGEPPRPEGRVSECPRA